MLPPPRVDYRSTYRFPATRGHEDKKTSERYIRILDRFADICSHRLIAMYVFELFYRPKISPVSVGHHIGTIMIGQSAIAISLNLVREKDATIEFILCTVWGMS
jgi:hypothetical protein